MNTFNLVGRLVKDIEYKENGDKYYGTITIAVDRVVYNKDTKQKESGFYNVKVFDKSCTFLRDYAKKGNYLAVSGELVPNSFIDRNGTKRYEMELLARSVEICWEKKEEKPSEEPSGFIPDAPVREEDKKIEDVKDEGDFPWDN